MGLRSAQLANSIGDGVFLVTSVLYATRVIGLSASQVGLALTIGWGAGLLAGVPVGHLADRRGPRGTAVATAVLTGAGVVSLLLATTFATFLAAVLVYTVAQCGLAAARQALLAGLVVPAERTRVRAQLQAVANAGLAIGAAIGGVALSVDTRPAYLSALGLDALALLVAALVLSRLPAVRRTVHVAGRPVLAVLRDRPYAAIAGLNAVLLLYMPLLSVVLPLWIVGHTDAPRWSAAALLILNTVGVVLFQVRIARRASGLTAASRSIRYAGGLLLGSCVVFALSAYGTSAWSAALVLLAAGVLQVFGEMLLASGSWEISFGLAPADQQGQYQGLFGTGVAVARMVGPLLLTTLVLGWGTPGFLVLGVLFLAAALAITPAVRVAERRGDRPVEGSAPTLAA